MSINENIVWHEHAIDKTTRSEQKKQKPLQSIAGIKILRL